MREFLHSAMATIKTIHALSRMRLTYGIILAILFLALATHSLQQILNGHGTQDFGYFYHAAQAMRQGQDIYAATKGHYIYPPFLAFVLQPLTLVPEQTAAIVWIIINASLMFGAALIAAQEGAARWHRSNASIDPSMPWAIAAVASILVADKIDTILILGQTEGIMLLGFACTLRWMDRRPLLAGAVVGLTASIKYVSLIDRKSVV